MKRILTVSLFCLLSPFAHSGPMPEGDAEAGKVKSYTCQFCPGQQGVASNDSYPHINNQNALYLYNSMKAYQRGERQGIYADMMNQQLSVLDDQDLADIASYFSIQP